MSFMIYALDKPNSLELRQATRAAHLEYVKNSGVKNFAAPLLDEDENMMGSLLLINVETRQEAESFAENDPYNQAGLFQSVEIQRYKKP